MPTQAEIDAGAEAISDTGLPLECREDIAADILDAAEAVRAAAVRMTPPHAPPRGPAD